MLASNRSMTIVTNGGTGVDDVFLFVSLDINVDSFMVLLSSNVFCFPFSFFIFRSYF